MKPDIDFVSYLDRHFATADWRTQDIWFQVRKRLKAEEEAERSTPMYKFGTEKCVFTDKGDVNIVPVDTYYPLDLTDALKQVLDFAKDHPNGQLINSDSCHLVEYEVDGAEFSCYVDYVE